MADRIVWDQAREKQRTLWEEYQRQLDRAEVETAEKKIIALDSARVLVRLIADLQDELDRAA